MKHKQTLWVMLCCLTIQVSSCLFDKCRGKKNAIKENIVVKTNNYYEQTDNGLGISEYQTYVIPDTIKEDKMKNQIELSKPIDVEKQLIHNGQSGLGISEYQTSVIPESIKEDEIKNRIKLWESIEVKKKFIHDGQSDLTEDQKNFVYATLSPMIKKFSRIQSSVITRLIVAFLWHRYLPEQCIGTAPGHQPVKRCQLSSDDSWLVSQSGDHDISLWNVATNQLQWTVKAHSAFITQSILSSDNQYIISSSGSGDNTIKIWTLLTGTLLCTLEGHTDWISGFSLSSDNQFLLSASDDKTVRMWSVSTGQCTKIFNGHSISVHCAHFYANDQRIVSTCKDVRVWDVATNQCIHVLHGHTCVIMTCNFSGDEQYLLSGSQDETVRVWDLTEGMCNQTFRGHKSWVWGGCFVQKDTWIASIDMDGTLCIWRVSDAHCMYQLQNYTCLSHFNTHTGSNVETQNVSLSALKLNHMKYMCCQLSPVKKYLRSKAMIDE